MHPIFHLVAAAAATAAPQPGIVSTEDIELQFAPRTPNQLMSFYEARGFPPAMTDILSKQCFITVRIHNKSDTTIWHDLDRWRAMDMPLASISTFRWTLLPEALDYLPEEAEGGNIILPRVDGPVSVTASFATGDDKQGKVITIEYSDLYCAEDKE